MSSISEIIETSPDQTAQRRMRVLHALAVTTLGAESRQACFDAAAKALAGAALDLPFVLFYVIDEARKLAQLAAYTGFTAEAAARIQHLDAGAATSWPFQAALTIGRPYIVSDVQARFTGLAAGPSAAPIASARMLSISPSTQSRVIAIVGTQARPERDDQTADMFLELLAASLTSALAATLVREQLNTLQLEHLDAQEASSHAEIADAAEVSLRPGRRPRVLLADSDTDMHDYIGRLLGPAYAVRAVADAEAVLQAVREAPPDILLLDVLLSGSDGIKLLQQLRAADRAYLMPVILLSARASEDSALAGLDAGADDYLVKPVSGKALRARVRCSLALAKLRKELADKLAEANKELDAFSYSVSHDLRAPLRSIDGFSKALLSDCASQLDDQGRRFLDRVRASTQRMAELMDDLLNLSRIARAPLVRELVDMTSISRRILSALAASDPQRKLETQVMAGLIVQGDSRLLAVVLEQLLGNAWKFTSKCPETRIEIGGEQRDGETVFFIRDNGVGFEMAYAKRLFTPFQRLHSAAEFQGTGIGLATVQRVVSRHAGRVWADAAPDRGATFYFTLAEAA